MIFICEGCELWENALDIQIPILKPQVSLCRCLDVLLWDIITSSDWNTNEETVS